MPEEFNNQNKLEIMADIRSDNRAQESALNGQTVKRDLNLADPETESNASVA